MSPSSGAANGFHLRITSEEVGPQDRTGKAGEQKESIVLGVACVAQQEREREKKRFFLYIILYSLYILCTCRQGFEQEKKTHN